jgi:hypothetical protein
VIFQIGNPSKLRHGHAKRGQQSGEFVCWQAMKSRCRNPKLKKFKYYGGAGVTVCDRWANSFEDFLADLGPRPSPKHSLDRFPNRKGNYEPGNVRWATKQQQTDNRDSTKMIVLNGQSLVLREVCAQKSLNLKVVARRLDLGWSPEKAISFPVKTVPYRPRPKARKKLDAHP